MLPLSNEILTSINQFNASQAYNPFILVYRRRAGSSAPLDLFLPGATRVTSMRVLGVVLSANLVIGNHLDEILSSSASSIHVLRMLRSHMGWGVPNYM